MYERLAAELALASIDDAIPEGLTESERLLQVLAGQLAVMATSPVDSRTRLALADLREELEGLRSALRTMESSTRPQTTIPRRHLVIFEVALRTFRNEAGCSD